MAKETTKASKEAVGDPKEAANKIKHVSRAKEIEIVRESQKVVRFIELGLYGLGAAIIIGSAFINLTN